MSDSIKKLKDIFSKFPTVGSRTAGRFVLYLLKLPKEKTDELIQAIQELKIKVKLCNFCFNPYEPFGAAQGGNQENLCTICQNTGRNKQLLCIVEKEADLGTIENSKRYNGLYFILGGALNLRQNNMDSLRLKELKERVKSPSNFGIEKADFKEIIVATNPTPEGKSTSILVEKALKEVSPSPSWKITHLAQGLPVGGELEYADEETLESAFEGRK